MESLWYNQPVEVKIDDLIREAEEARKWIRKPSPEGRQPMTQKKWQEILDDREVNPGVTFKG